MKGIKSLTNLLTFEKEVREKEEEQKRFLRRDEIIYHHTRLFPDLKKYIV